MLVPHQQRWLSTNHVDLVAILSRVYCRSSSLMQQKSMSPSLESGFCERHRLSNMGFWSSIGLFSFPRPGGAGLRDCEAEVMRTVCAVIHSPLIGAHRTDQGMGRGCRAGTEQRDRLAQPLRLRHRVEPGARAIAGREGHPLGDRPTPEHRPPGQTSKGYPPSTE